METTITTLRTSAGFSQSQMAEKMNISRPTYVAMEKGDREMTLTEIQNLAKILGTQTEVFLPKKEVSPKSSMDKFRQIVKNCIKFGADKDGKITKTKLAKLVYLCDFANYYFDLEPMTGFEYKRLAQGPVTMEFFATIDEDSALAVETKGRAQLISLVETPSDSEIQPPELKLLKKICEKWQPQNTQTIVDFTHQQMPWAMSRENEVIPYSLIHTEELENVY